MDLAAAIDMLTGVAIKAVVLVGFVVGAIFGLAYIAQWAMVREQKKPR